MAIACSSLQIPSFLPSGKPHDRSLSIPTPLLLSRSPQTLPSFTLFGQNPISGLFRPSNKHLPYAAISSDGNGSDNPREEGGGIVGIYGGHDASRLCYYALRSLQHRGLDQGADIVSLNGSVLNSITGTGLVSDQLTGNSAIGQLRYSADASSTPKNVQPFDARYRFGSVAIAHDGNLVNYTALRHKLVSENGSILKTSSNTEAVLHLIATSKKSSYLERISEACEQIQGAYSFVFLTEDDKLIAARDPHGFRPLVMGRIRSTGAIIFASETCALEDEDVEADVEREVCPGEIILVDKDGVQSMFLNPRPTPKHCIFEHIFLSRIDSDAFGRSVYESRHKFGELLATSNPVDCDVVIAGLAAHGLAYGAAAGYAAKTGEPDLPGLIRSFNGTWDLGVNLTLTPVKEVLEGKRVVVVGDSLGSGTISLEIVRMIRKAGAKEVHMRIASPPIISWCCYGVAMPSSEELISNRMSVEEIREFIGADSLAFLPLEALREAMGSDSSSYCYACFLG